LIDNMVDALRDDHWKRVRTVISPAFATGKLRQMVPLIRECVHTLTDNLDKIIAESNGELTAPVDMKQLAGAYAMEAIIKVAFGSKVSALTDVNHPIIKYVRKMTDPGGFNLAATLVTLAPKVAQLLRIPLYDTSVTEFFKEFALKLIDERKRETQMGKGCKRADFLQLILNEMSGLKEGSDDKDVGNGSEKYGEIQAPDMVGKSMYSSYINILTKLINYFINSHYIR
jgi:cytochrome P450